MVVDNTVQWLQLNLKETGLPVGFEYFTMNQNIPAGSLPLQGGLYSRLAYPDLWEWVQKQAGYLKAESEWQELAVSNGGNVPFYSSGDGSTTFRVPSLNCWVKGANGIEEVGSYLSAGLPNITGTIESRPHTSGNTKYSGAVVGASGAFKFTKMTSTVTNTGCAESSTESSNDVTTFSAQTSNPIYGNSDTVQPKSIVGMWLVKAYGTVTNVGNIDVADIEQGLTELETRVTPIGTIYAFAGNNIPNGYLPCNGSAISRTTYADLFAVIGTTYGSGDGSTTFNLPNLSTNLISNVSTGNLQVKGNGIALGLTDGTNNYGLSDTRSGTLKWSPLVSNDKAYGKTVGGTTEESIKNRVSFMGITTDGSKSGMIVSMSATKTTVKYIIKY